MGASRRREVSVQGAARTPLAVGDFNGDRLLDMAVGKMDSGDVSVVMNDTGR